MTTVSTPEAKGVRIDWYRSPIEKSVLRHLIKRSDWQGFSHVTGHLLLVAATGSLAYFAFQLQHWVLMAVALFAHGTCYSFLGWAGAGHELAHRTVFRTNIFNEVFLRLFAFLSWSNYAYFWSSHTRHHQATVYTGLDGEVKLPQTINYASWMWAIVMDLPLLYRVLRTTCENSLNIIRGDWGTTLFPEKNSKSRRQVVSWARFMLLGHISLVGVFVLSGQWPLLFLITLAPFYSNWLNKVLAQAQHFGMQPDVPDFRLNARTIRLNPLFGFLYWKMNYHVEHHMYPSVPFHNLERLRREIEHDLPPATDGILTVLQEMHTVKRRQQHAPRY